MKANEGVADRAVRFIAGVAAIAIALLVLDLTAGAVLGIVVAAVGAVLLVTSLAGFCPAYRLIGVNTCKVAPAD